MWWEGGGVRNWAPHDSEHNVRQPKKESVDVVDRRGFQAGDLPHQAWARATPEEWVGVTRRVLGVAAASSDQIEVSPIASRVVQGQGQEGRCV